MKTKMLFISVWNKLACKEIAPNLLRITQHGKRNVYEFSRIVHIPSPQYLGKFCSSAVLTYLESI